MRVVMSVFLVLDDTIQTLHDHLIVKYVYHERMLILVLHLVRYVLKIRIKLLLAQ